MLNITGKAWMRKRLAMEFRKEGRSDKDIGLLYSGALDDFMKK
jgi:hypothetical protein